MFLIRIGITVFFLALSSYYSADGQTIRDEHSLALALDSLITERVFNGKKPRKKITIRFAFKIEPTGEVRSAHVKDCKNIKYEDLFKACLMIEMNFNLKFLSDKFPTYDIAPYQIVWLTYYYNGRNERRMGNSIKISDSGDIRSSKY